MHFKLAVSLALIIASNSAIANSPIPSMSGNYVGEAQNSEEMAKTTTSLTKNDKGIISGEYAFIEEGNEIKGELTGCETIESTHLKCIWKDKYGYGDLELIFNGSFTKFYGAWNSFGSNKKYVWYGVKQ